MDWFAPHWCRFFFGGVALPSMWICHPKFWKEAWLDTCANCSLMGDRVRLRRPPKCKLIPFPSTSPSVHVQNDISGQNGSSLVSVYSSIGRLLESSDVTLSTQSNFLLQQARANLAVLTGQGPLHGRTSGAQTALAMWPGGCRRSFDLLSGASSYDKLLQIHIDFKSFCDQVPAFSLPSTKKFAGSNTKTNLKN